MLQDFTRKFKLSKDILNSHMGRGIISKKFVESMDDYEKSNPTKISELVKVADEQFASYLYLVNSDQRKYRSVIKGLYFQKEPMNDLYSKTVVKRNNVLSTHRFEYSKYYSSKNN